MSGANRPGCPARRDRDGARNRWIWRGTGSNCASSNESGVAPIHRTGAAPFASASTVLAATIILAALQAPVLAGGGTWSNSSGGAWETGTNWSSNAQPTSLDNVDFTLANTYTVTLSGAGAASNVRINGGTVTFDLGGNTITSGSGTLHVAALTTQVASLTLSNGTLITNGATDSNVGNGISAAGRLTLNNATFTLAQTLYVGNTQGSGSLTLDSGSRLNSGSWTVIGNGSFASARLLVQNGSKLVSNLSNLIGYGSGATGIATISGSNSSMISTNGIIDVGDGGTGTLLVDNGATASSGTFTLIGFNSGSGTMLIQNGGQVTAADRGIIGWQSTGYASVSGTNSKFTISSGFLDVGDNGQGTLQISSGGEVNLTGNGFIGFSTGTGRLIITGANSKLTASGSMDIGNGGTGAMTLLSSGAATINGTLKVYTNGSLSLASGEALTVGDPRSWRKCVTVQLDRRDPADHQFTAQRRCALTVPDTATLAGSGSVGRATTVAPRRDPRAGRQRRQAHLHRQSHASDLGSDPRILRCRTFGYPERFQRRRHL